MNDCILFIILFPFLILLLACAIAALGCIMIAIMEIATMPIEWWFDRKERRLGTGDGSGSSYDVSDPLNVSSPASPLNGCHTNNF